MACLKPAIHVCSSMDSLFSLQSACQQICTSIKVRSREILSDSRAVGQMSGSLNPRSSPSADDPRQTCLSSEKTFKVSCEESLTSFYTSLKFLFLLSVSHETYKTSFTSLTSTVEQKKSRNTTGYTDTGPEEQPHKSVVQIGQHRYT